MGFLKKVLGGVGGGGAAANGEALTPIAGVSLEQYAELCARMARIPEDDDAYAAIAADQGVDRAAWEAARSGWNARMEDPATAGQVALAYMPLYQAALAEHGGEAATASFDDYIEMSAMINTDTTEPDRRPTDLEAMYERFGITAVDWSQISTHWVGRLTTETDLAQEFARRSRERVQALDEEFLSRG
jgi:hypothetical protein